MSASERRVFRTSFDELIEPLPARQFLREIFGKHPIHISGRTNRFDYLLTWDALNRILSERRLDSLDLRVMKEGKRIARDSYIRRVYSEFLGEFEQLDIPSLLHHFRDGATLVLNRFRDMHEPTSTLSDILEEVFKSYVEVVVFAGGHGTEALEPHWDPEETIVVQVDGAKHWRVWWPTRRHALVLDRNREFPPPSSLFWEGTLRPGDLLHIPRGWWHVAKPDVISSLHITFAVRPATGVDLARSILKEVDELRGNIPRDLTGAEQQAYLTQFRKAVVTALDNISLPQFFADIDSNAPSRAYASLPWSALPSRVLPETAQLRWCPPRSLQLAACGELMHLEALGTVFRFSKVAKPVLTDLIEHRVTTLHALRERHPAENIEPFVAKLVSAGLVAITGA